MLRCRLLLFLSYLIRVVLDYVFVVFFPVKCMDDFITASVFGVVRSIYFYGLQSKEVSEAVYK